MLINSYDCDCDYECNAKRFKRNFKNWTSDNPSSITLEFINKIAVPHKVFGITQDPETKNYMVVSNINKCGICYATCNSMCFQRNFENWTSASITLKLINKIAVSSKVYGITQNPETKNYMW
ncbi:kinase-like domain-containing protein [Rhizophagus irregularis DAOM 181602=DAOM 197198]|nr:kinase-like domain-containing protein [Rhizophagus irregularis DAOM 181602=DAOM 197198]